MSFETQYFDYGTDGKTVRLSATVPVWTCSSCGEQYTDSSAEDIRHATICKYLGRLTPTEIASIRADYAMTQSEWAALTGFGIASVKRWEAGSLIQNSSSDRLLRLLRFPANVDELKRLERQQEQTKLKQAKFRTHFDQETLADASAFRLRKAQSLVETA